jgi:hypothetical protein
MTVKAGVEQVGQAVELGIVEQMGGGHGGSGEKGNGG